MADFANQDLIMSIFSAAAEDKTLLERLQTDPASVFAEAGISVPPETRDAFNVHVAMTTGPAFVAMAAQGPLALMAWPSLKCSACTIACWGIGVVVIGIGAAAIATLTVSSPVVLSLASFAGVSAAAALAFVKTVAPLIALGIAAVANKICEWCEACP